MQCKHVVSDKLLDTRFRQLLDKLVCLAVLSLNNILQGRYLPNSKWAPCDPDDEAIAEDAQRRQVNNVAGAACVTHVMLSKHKSHNSFVCCCEICGLMVVSTHATKEIWHNVLCISYRYCAYLATFSHLYVNM